MKNLTLHASTTGALALFFLLALGSKSDPNAKGGEGGAVPAVAEVVGEGRMTASGKQPPNFDSVMATCNNKTEGKCDEFYGFIPKFSPDDCPKEGGVWQRGGAACPKANLLGTCHYPQSKQGEPGEFVNFYVGSTTNIADAKKECLEQTGGGQPKEWIDAPPPAAASASAAPAVVKPGAAAKPTAAAAAKPSAKPATSAKPK